MYAAVSAACKEVHVSKRSSRCGPQDEDTYQVVQLDGGDTLVDTRDNLLGDSSSVDMFRVKAITESRYTSRDFIELYAFFASVCRKNRISKGSVGQVAVRPARNFLQKLRHAPRLEKGGMEGLGPMLTSLVDKHFSRV
jgi:hypothetical protein